MVPILSTLPAYIVLDEYASRCASQHLTISAKAECCAPSLQCLRPRRVSPFSGRLLSRPPPVPGDTGTSKLNLFVSPTSRPYQASETLPLPDPPMQLLEASHLLAAALFRFIFGHDATPFPNFRRSSDRLPLYSRRSCRSETAVPL